MIMSKHKNILKGALALVFIGAIIGLLTILQDSSLKFKSDDQVLTLSEVPVFEEGDSPENENPAKRWQFEFDRLKNPTTGKIPVQINLQERAFLKEMLEEYFAPADQSGGQKFSESTQASESTASNVVNRGPFNVGGRTRALAIDMNNENVILAGGVSGGIWRSSDQGQTWTRTSALDQQPAVTALIQDRRSGKGDTWYYGTGERRGNSANADGAFYYGNGIYKSTDNGQSWSLIPQTAVSGTSGTDVITSTGIFTRIDELAMDYSNASEDEVYMAGSGRIVRSTDGFQNSAIVLGNNNSVNMVDVAVTSTGIVYATIGNLISNGSGAQEGVWRSADGISWNNITPTSGLESEYFRLELGIDPSNENMVYVLGDQSLLKWNDGTQEWTDLSDALEIPSDPDSRDGVSDFSTQQYYDQLVTVHPNNSDAVFIGGTNIYRSLDGFTTTSEKKQIGGYNIDNHHPDQHKIVFFDSDPNKMLSGDDGGVHITQNNLADASSTAPVTWQDLNNGYLTTQFYHGDINNMDFADPIIIGGTQDNGTWIVLNTTDPSAAWSFIGGGDGAWAGYTYNAFYHSSQNGWVDRRELVDNTIGNAVDITPIGDVDTDAGRTEREEEFLFINPFEYNLVNQDQVVIGGKGRAFFTHDVRTNPGIGEWFEIASPDLTGNDANVTAMAFSTEPEGVLYLGTEVGTVHKVTNSQNIRGNVQAEDLPWGDMPEGTIGAIKVHPADADHVIVTFTNYEVISVWESRDGGQTWSSISGNLEENQDGSGRGPSIRSFEIMPDGNGGFYYFAGTSVGLFMTQTLDGDNTVWTQQGADVIGNVVVSWIRVRPIEGLVMVSTHANGVFTANYEVGVNPFINYSFDETERTFTIRGNRSFSSARPLAHQWLKNGEIIDGENGTEIQVTDGGEYQLRLFFSNDESALSNKLVFNVDGSGPDITQIVRFDPTSESTSGTSVTFEVTFSEAVLNVDASDFETTGDASGTVSGAEEVTQGLTYRVSVSAITGAGSLGLGVASSNNITDQTGNPFSGVISSAETYTIVDGAAPTAAISRLNPTSSVTNQAEVSFQVLFSEPIVNFGVTDLEFAAGSVGASFGNLREITAGVSFEVNVIEIEGDGTVGIGFSSSQDIEDTSGNAFAGEVTSNESFTIENIVTSIDERYLIGNSKIIVDRNPSDGIFYLGFPDSFVGDFDFGVVTSSGRVISQEMIENYASGQQIKLDLTKEADGVFVVRARNEGEELTVKLLKRSN